MNLVERTLEFANRAHAGMVRKNGRLPYILHPMEAAVIVSSMTSDPEAISAALLHDVVEDAGITLDEIRNEFGDRVAALVASETEDKFPGCPAGETWMQRKLEAVAFLQGCDDACVKMLYLGDKLSNIRSLCRGYREMGEAMWQCFNQTDPEKHHWYYRSICNAIADLSPYPAWQEFDRLIRELFNEDENTKGA